MAADRVLGASDVTGELVFLMKFKDQDNAEMIPARIANVKCPQLVIQFYEERLMWHSDNEEDGGGDSGVTPDGNAVDNPRNGSVDDDIASDDST